MVNERDKINHPSEDEPLICFIVIVFLYITTFNLLIKTLIGQDVIFKGVISPDMENRGTKAYSLMHLNC